MKLTPAACRDAPIGSTLRDHEVTGLQLRVRATKRTWHLYYRAAGAERRPALGTFPAMSLNAARAAARELLQRVARGEDPSASRREARQAETVAELCDLYLAHCRMKNLAPATLENYAGYIRTRIKPAWGRRRVRDITRADVDRLVSDLERTAGPSEANHVRVQVRAMWYRAADTFGILPPGSLNPVTGSYKAAEMQRTRLASAEELARIFETLAGLVDEKPAHVAAVVTLFLTGMRPGEVERARVHEWRGDHFVIRDHKTSRRTGEAKVHYVHPTAAEMINALPTASNPLGDLLFGGIILQGFWRRVRKAAGCPDLQLRDARRTFASYGISEEAPEGSLDRVSQLLGHKQRQTTLRYAHLITDKRARMANEIADRLLAVAKGGS